MRPVHQRGDARFTNDLSDYADDLDGTHDGNVLTAIQRIRVSEVWTAPSADSAQVRQLTSGETAYGTISPGSSHSIYKYTCNQRDSKNSSLSDSKDFNNGFKVETVIGSAARKGESVARRRFQKGSVYPNKSKTQWLGMYADYVLDSQGIERRIRKQVILCPMKTAEMTVSKRQAQKLLQPYLDRVNSSISAPSRERKNATLNAFLEIWERDYLSLYKPSTQASMRVHLKRIKATFGKKEMREIDAGDIQRIISAMQSGGADPKSIRNLWATIRLIWDAALAQKYVDALLPKPKLPRKSKRKPKCFTLPEVARIIAAAQGEHQVLYLFTVNAS